jgi:hypothetical protein
VPQSEVSRLVEPQGDIAAELSAITQEFPGWRPWVSDGGRWWATRLGAQPADPPGWWAITVDADDADKLRKAIAEQERLESTVGAT